jgi:hypothetical protein
MGPRRPAKIVTLTVKLGVGLRWRKHLAEGEESG